MSTKGTNLKADRVHFTTTKNWEKKKKKPNYLIRSGIPHCHPMESIEFLIQSHQRALLNSKGSISRVIQRNTQEPSIRNSGCKQRQQQCVSKGRSHLKAPRAWWQGDHPGLVEQSSSLGPWLQLLPRPPRLTTAPQLRMLTFFPSSNASHF